MELCEFKSASAVPMNHAFPPPPLLLHTSEYTCLNVTVPERDHPLSFHPLASPDAGQVMLIVFATSHSAQITRSQLMAVAITFGTILL
jgi:hypothetical protein